MEAYQACDHGRSMGHSAPNPISVSEVMAYCSGVGIASVTERAKYLRLIQKLDLAFLAHWSEKNKKT